MLEGEDFMILEAVQVDWKYGLQKTRVDVFDISCGDNTYYCYVT